MVGQLDANSFVGDVSAAEITVYDPDLVRMLYDAAASAGSYAFCWDQKDQDGLAVAPGVYKAEMTAGQFEDEYFFEIVASGTPVPSGCDSLGLHPPSGGGMLPSQYGFRLLEYEYVVGDTIRIEWDLPAMTETRIRIRQPD